MISGKNDEWIATQQVLNQDIEAGIKNTYRDRLISSENLENFHISFFIFHL